MQPPLKCCAQILQPCAGRGAAVVSVQQNGPRTRPCEQSWVGQGTGRRGKHLLFAAAAPLQANG